MGARRARGRCRLRPPLDAAAVRDRGRARRRPHHEQLQRLEKVAAACPVRRSIEAGIRIQRNDRHAAADALVPTGGSVVSKKRIVILGGGTGGTLTANRLRRRFEPTRRRSTSSTGTIATSTSPVCSFVPFGLASSDEIVRPRRRQLRDGVLFHEAEVASVALDRDAGRAARRRAAPLRRARRRQRGPACSPRRPRG